VDEWAIFVVQGTRTESLSLQVTSESRRLQKGDQWETSMVEKPGTRET